MFTIILIYLKRNKHFERKLIGIIEIGFTSRCRLRVVAAVSY